MRILTLLFVATLANIANAQGSSIETFVRIQGVLQIGEFFGPPNYGEDVRADRRERWFYLQLPTVLTAQGVTLPHDSNVEKREEYFVQLRFDKAQYKRALAMIGRKISVTGTLEPAETGHDHTSLVMNARELVVLKDWRW